jgi:hypothetical protein
MNFKWQPLTKERLVMAELLLNRRMRIFHLKTQRYDSVTQREDCH